MLYGDDTCSIITKNLPPNEFSAAVKVGLCAMLLGSYPVQFFPVTQALEKPWRNPAETEEEEIKRRYIFYLYRGGLVILTAAVAIGIPNFALFLSLMGSFSNSLAALILPPLFYLRVFQGQLDLGTRMLNWAILCMGIIAIFVSGTFSVISLVDFFVYDKHSC
eukprot:GFYU01014996.1.p1 GENE.GFYU01014996.1~~GFYU01014996.1.p1  ORF type:complete len:163 (-),score=41.67 GFYU01014996.1:334-822(-)